MLPVLLEHKNNPIGRVLDIKQDEFGIKFILGVWEEVPQMYLSFGFRVLDYEVHRKIRTLKSLNVHEISLVHFPAQEGTHVTKKSCTI